MSNFEAFAKNFVLIIEDQSHRVNVYKKLADLYAGNLDHILFLQDENSKAAKFFDQTNPAVYKIFKNLLEDTSSAVFKVKPGYISQITIPKKNNRYESYHLMSMMSGLRMRITELMASLILNLLRGYYKRTNIFQQR